MIAARAAGLDPSTSAPSSRHGVDRLAFVPGRLAQLGERRLDKAEVTGSSPVSPTAFGPVVTGLFAFLGSLAEGAKRLLSHRLPT